MTIAPCLTRLLDLSVVYCPMQRRMDDFKHALVKCYGLPPGVEGWDQSLARYSVANNGSAAMILVNCSEPLTGACAGGVAMIVELWSKNGGF
jgi:hypothetical protein